MHVRFSICLGTPIVAENAEERAGTLSGVLLHPDLGTVEGFFVQVPGMFRAEHLFLSAMDIVHWGSRIRIRDEDVLSPLEDRVRLSSLYHEGRTILGQKILTESNVALGTCRDLQFETKTFRLEWIFPKKWLRWGAGIPVTAIIEVRKEAVIVRDLAAGIEEKAPSVLKALDQLTEAPVPPRLPEAS